MYSLDNFYQGNDWRTLLKQLKQERTDAHGNIICAYCGKPILKAYDIIGHHKIELTEENVNDFTISLNPELIDLVHGRCHNYIHNKLGYAHRQVYLVYGPPCAGKSTYVKDVAQEGDLIIDMDNIWQAVSGCSRYVKPGRLKAVVFSVRDNLLDSVKYRRGKWNNAYVIGGYPLSSERERLVNELGAREVFIDTSKEDCISRLKADDARDFKEWLQYIEDWYRRYNCMI